MNTKNVVLGASSLAIISLVAIGLVAYTNKDNSTPSDSTTAITPTPSVASALLSYKDGEYTATGRYTSPGGTEEITVKLNLKDNIIETIEATPRSDNSTSQLHQTIFVNNFKSKVVGKRIDVVTLDKVSGSSLTSRGFNQAINDIKNQAVIKS